MSEERRIGWMDDGVLRVMLAAAAKGVFFNVHISNRAYSVICFHSQATGTLT